jgi:predicted N-acetyltransferase YhbS
MKTDIRPETKADYAPIYRVHRFAFGRTNESTLVERLRKTKRFIPELSLVARHQNQVIGHILFYPVDIVKDDRTVEALALAPVAVLPQFQNKGVGGKLVKVGLSKAKKLGYKAVIVLGHAEYYPHFGFAPASTWGITAPFEVPDNAFMALELVPGALSAAAGTVRYAQEFSRV